MLNVSKPDGYILNEHAILVVGRAKLQVLTLLEEDPCDQIGTVVPELEDVLVEVIAELLCGEAVVLFDDEVSSAEVFPEDVGHCAVDELPLVLLEVLRSWLVSHRFGI